MALRPSSSRARWRARHRAGPSAADTVPLAADASSPRPRFARRWAVALIASMVLGLSALTLAACQPHLSLAALDQRVYSSSLPSFERWWLTEQAELRHTSVPVVRRWLDEAPARFDDARSRSGPWDLSTDRCSASPDRGPAFDFRWPCIRHDLAWRNLRRLDHRSGRIDTRARRIRATDRFFEDLLATCAPKPFVARTACRTLARAYYQAVLLVS